MKLYLPWHADGWEVHCDARLDMLHVVARTYDAEIAQHIAEAVNAEAEQRRRAELYPELVEALKQISQLECPNPASPLGLAQRQARVALKLCEKEG